MGQLQVAEALGRAPRGLAGQLRAAGGLLVDLLYPTRCVACGAFGPVLCERCSALLVGATGLGRCPNCCAAWQGEHNCPGCVHWAALDGGISAYEMAGPARAMVHALKYRRARVVVPGMVQAITGVLDGRAFDAILPVPLHAGRYRERGFNQAELLARGLGGRILPGLRRVRRTGRQVGSDLSARRANVAGAFAYAGEPLGGLTVAVVDDVITTGATVNECARVLRDHGARRVIAVSYARAS